jgi:lipopolysaccharide export system permease protein
MTVHREVMAAKAGGSPSTGSWRRSSSWGFSSPGLGLALAEVVPHANARSAELRGDREVRQAWQSNQCTSPTQGSPSRSGRITAADGRMVGVVVFSEGGPGRRGGPVVHITAEEARWTRKRGWRLRNGFLRELEPDGEERLERFVEKLPYDRLTERPEDLVETVRDEDEMTREQLAMLADRVTRSGGDPGRLEVKREQRLAIPVATLIIILFGAPLATSSKRGGAAFGIGLSLATTILYLVLFRVARGLRVCRGTWIPGSRRGFRTRSSSWRGRFFSREHEPERRPAPALMPRGVLARPTLPSSRLSPR